jgi:Sugar (and other) transporter
MMRPRAGHDDRKNGGGGGGGVANNVDDEDENQHDHCNDGIMLNTHTRNDGPRSVAVFTTMLPPTRAKAATTTTTSTTTTTTTTPSLDEVSSQHQFLLSLAAVAGNVLEWYDFAVFGFFGEVIGDVFFPPSDNNNNNNNNNMQTVQAFAVFGGAFLMRPVGGMLLGYIGDTHGRKKALIISIFLMAFPTFAMGCLPSYQRAGSTAIFLLILTRLLQGVSVGGQLMSSMVYTLEKCDDRSVWGLYGSFVLAAGKSHCMTLTAASTFVIFSFAK